MRYAFVRGRNRRVIRFERLIVCGFLRRNRCSPVCLALKWLCPGRRVINLPFRVTFIRFVYDLLVFILSIASFSFQRKVWQL